MQSSETARKKPKSRCASFSPIDMFGSPVEFNIRGEDTYKTFFGCFWSLVMVGTMLAAIIYYFIIYLDTTKVTMTSQLLQSAEPPAMNFKENGLFISLAINKGNKMLKESDVMKYFSISANLFEYTQTTTTATDGSTDKQMNDKPTVTKIVFKPCKSAGITGKVNGKTIKGKKAMMTRITTLT